MNDGEGQNVLLPSDKLSYWSLVNFLRFVFFRRAAAFLPISNISFVRIGADLFALRQWCCL